MNSVKRTRIRFGEYLTPRNHVVKGFVLVFDGKRETTLDVMLAGWSPHFGKMNKCVCSRKWEIKKNSRRSFSWPQFQFCVPKLLTHESCTSSGNRCAWCISTLTCEVYLPSLPGLPERLRLSLIMKSICTSRNSTTRDDHKQCCVVTPEEVAQLIAEQQEWICRQYHI